MGRPHVTRLPCSLRTAAAAALLVALVAGVGCGAGERETPAAPPPGIAVASFNFAESRLVAEIYAQALEDDGVGVRRELDLGPRELVLPALRQGLVDIVPEYLGTALTTAAPGVRVDRKDPDAVSDALAAAVQPWGLRVLPHAAAQNQNAVVVTRATAHSLSLATTSDLDRVAPMLRIGGPPECPERPHCLAGLSAVYGLRFAEFLPFDGAGRVQRALEDGVIDVGVLFTTDGALASGELIMLTDDRELQPVENLVPVVRSTVLDGPEGERVADALAEVSQRLSTDNLRFLNWRVSVAGNDPAAEAHGWLVRQGLVER